jgi:hypothetical protein
VPREYCFQVARAFFTTHQKGHLAISSQAPYSPYSVRPHYRSAHSRANFVSILLIAGILLHIASFLLSILELLFPNLAAAPGEDIAEPEVLVVALLQLGLAVILVLLYLATVVAFLLWLYHSHENLPSFGIRKNNLEYSSAWAVGSFFVPFVTLVVPYRAIKELWSKSVPNSADLFPHPSPPGFFPLWWAAWLITNFAGQTYLRLSWGNRLSQEASSVFGALTSVLNILAAILAIMVIREIDRQQLRAQN